MGWVTLFQPEELAELLHLPNDVETLGWLCLGWPDERPPAPGLERRGWSRRVPLSDVTLADRWPDSAQPEAPVSALRQTLHSPIVTRLSPLTTTLTSSSPRPGLSACSTRPSTESRLRVEPRSPAAPLS